MKKVKMIDFNDYQIEISPKTKKKVKTKTTYDDIFDYSEYMTNQLEKSISYANYFSEKTKFDY